jgi:hypothetical protein
VRCSWRGLFEKKAAFRVPRKTIEVCKVVLILPSPPLFFGAGVCAPAGVVQARKNPGVVVDDDQLSVLIALLYPSHCINLFEDRWVSV